MLHEAEDLAPLDRVEGELALLANLVDAALLARAQSLLREWRRDDKPGDLADAISQVTRVHLEKIEELRKNAKRRLLADTSRIEVDPAAETRAPADSGTEPALPPRRPPLPWYARVALPLFALASVVLVVLEVVRLSRGHAEESEAEDRPRAAQGESPSNEDPMEDSSTGDPALALTNEGSGPAGTAASLARRIESLASRLESIDPRHPIVLALARRPEAGGPKRVAEPTKPPEIPDAEWDRRFREAQGLERKGETHEAIKAYQGLCGEAPARVREMAGEKFRALIQKVIREQVSRPRGEEEE